VTRARLACATAAAVALAVALPEAALAHGIQGKRDLPIPEWLFGWAAALVLLVSFVALAVLWPKPRLEEDDGWRPLGRVGRALASRPVDIACGTIGVLLLVLTVYSGLAGENIPRSNFAPTFVYVVFWVGLVVASVLLGDVFRAFNPWRAVGRAVSWTSARLGSGEPSEPFEYPERLGRWPAAAGLLGFTVLELALRSGDEPRTLGIAILIYSGLTWFCMSLYGVERWCDRGEGFSVYFGLLARLSVFERRGDVVGRRRFLSGLPRIDVVPGTVGLLAVVIGSTSFDGFTASKAWSENLALDLKDLFEGIGFGGEAAQQLAAGAGLVAACALIYGFYTLGIRGVRTVGGDLDVRRLSEAFVHSLVPIGVAYVMAHYVSLLLYEAQGIPALLSDPLAKGSDLLGWADVTIDYTWIGNETLWYFQVAFVILGHVLALTLAHDRALALYERASAAARSQYWMLGVMVGFTCLALWLLSEAAQG
jgi:hypothetical protein